MSAERVEVSVLRCKSNVRLGLVLIVSGLENRDRAVLDQLLLTLDSSDCDDGELDELLLVRLCAVEEELLLLLVSDAAVLLELDDCDEAELSDEDVSLCAVELDELEGLLLLVSDATVLELLLLLDGLEDEEDDVSLASVDDELELLLADDGELAELRLTKVELLLLFELLELVSDCAVELEELEFELAELELEEELSSAKSS